jgi:hypothetical protein
MTRSEVFASDKVAVVHVMNRVIRRCYLLGIENQIREQVHKNIDLSPDPVFARKAGGFLPVEKLLPSRCSGLGRNISANRHGSQVSVVGLLASFIWGA